MEKEYTKADMGRQRLTGALWGGLLVLGVMIACGETGGNYMRGELRRVEAEQAAYQTQCEASVNRALGAVALAEKALQGR